MTEKRELGPVGSSILFENDLVRIWEVLVEPDGKQLLHEHQWPYVVVAVEPAMNRITWEDGKVKNADEKVGDWIYSEPGHVHELHNVGNTRYRNRLIEIKVPRPAAGAEGGPEAKEGHIHTDEMDWRPKSLPGLYEKMLWRDETTGASFALVRFEKGVGIPKAHKHPSNQFMFCLSGEYEYLHTGVVLRPGTFYWNPKDSVHGPTLAREESVLLEFYDGPHYYETPEYYTDPQDAR